jgi:hypothetical protein
MASFAKRCGLGATWAELPYLAGALRFGFWWSARLVKGAARVCGVRRGALRRRCGVGATGSELPYQARSATYCPTRRAPRRFGA